ncbi:MAG: hypothetical protein LBG11_12335 [Bifidobacteriaceae bacterium]|jgi:BirA family biotin operon repressor/biotin-[acetyl-CoA-carboxylase] ligase|nr:hypothetical protein [Bifidobacteriaceae bacterium]
MSYRPLNAERIIEALVKQGPYAGVDVFLKTDSTNAELLRRVAASSRVNGASSQPASGLTAVRQDSTMAPTPTSVTALLAEHQTAGRGRLHPGESAPRVWEAPARSSVLASILVGPAGPAALPKTLLGLALGLAAVQALDLFLPVRTSLKWPNDVMAQGRKLAGVLASATPGGAVVVGIGLNVHQTEAALPGPQAASCATLGAPDVDRTWLAIAVLAAAATLFERWARGDRRLLPEITARIDGLGQTARVHQPDGRLIEGRLEGLELDGALRLRQASGEVALVYSGWCD